MSAPADEQRAKEDALLEKANAIRTRWKTLATAFDFPHEEPPRNKCHWDFVLQEGAWLAMDMQQERLWKQAAACQLAQEASQFKRASLKHADTRVVRAFEYEDKELGQVKADGKPDFPESVTKGTAAAHARVSSASIKAEEKAHEDSSSDREEIHIGPLVFLCSPEIVSAVTEHLEQEDVGRLARHADAQAAYTMAYEAARRVQPPHFIIDEDDLPLGKRKRKIKPGSLVLPGVDEDGYELGASPMAGRPPRPRPGSIAPMPQRGAMDVDAAGQKRKRKAGDYGDEEFDPKAMRAAPMRAGSMGNMAMAAGGVDKKAAMAQKGGMAGMKSPQNKAGLQRIDPRTGARPGGQLWQQRQAALNQGPWTAQDDQLLIAIVTEFNQNWHLVADVLRSASTMSGIHRKWDACKHRYMMLQKHYATTEDPETGELRTDEKALSQPMMSKVNAKDMISQCLPVPENVLQHHRGIIADLAARLRQRRMSERKQTRESHMYKAQDNPSHQRIQQGIISSTPANRVLNPLEIGVVPMDPAFHTYRKAQSEAAKAAMDAAQAGGGGQQPGAAAGGQRAAGQGLGNQSEAAAAAAAQAQEAARAAAAAVAGQGPGSNQAGGGSTGPGAGGVKGPPQLPPGLTKEDMLQIVKNTPLEKLQEEAHKAQIKARENQTRENQMAASRAAAIFAYGDAYRRSQQQRQQQAGQGSATGQRPGQPGAGPPAAPPAAPMPMQQNVPAQIPQLGAQLQAAVKSGRVMADDAKRLVQLVQQGRVAPAQVMSALQNPAEMAALMQRIQQALQSGGAMQPPQQVARSMSQASVMQPGQGGPPGMPGQAPGMWGNPSAQAAAAAAHQAAQAAAAAAAQQYGGQRPPGAS